MDQLIKLITGLTIKQRLSILVAALLVGAGTISFVHWRHEGDFRPLYTSMAPEDAATVVQKLKETGVEYRLSDSGSAVMVPSAKLAESRLALAAAGLPKTGRIGFELFDKSNFGATEFVEHINYKRALEGELERSVMSLAEVEQARVHLTLPKESVFLDQQQPAKASVMLKLRPGARVSPQNVLAVTNLVASAVEGLSPEGVSVVDMDGTLLSRPKRSAAPDGSEITSESLEMRQQIERSLIAKISETLEPLLGPKRFRAGASVDFDLTSGEQQEETLDPTHSVMVSSQKTEDVTERASSAGIPGTASNLPAPPAAPVKGSGGVSRRTENIAYQTSRVIRHIRIPQGVIKRISLAVLVDQSVRWEGEGLARHRVFVPPAPETLKTIKDLVAGVTGLNTERGDQLVVETLPFEFSLGDETQPGTKQTPVSQPTNKDPAWVTWVRSHLWAPISLGVAILLVMARILTRLGKRRKTAGAEVHLPDQLEAPADAAQVRSGAGASASTQMASGPGEVRTISAGDHVELPEERVRQLAKQEPTLTASVLRAWLQESET